LKIICGHLLQFLPFIWWSSLLKRYSHFNYVHKSETHKYSVLVWLLKEGCRMTGISTKIPNKCCKRVLKTVRLQSISHVLRIWMNEHVISLPKDGFFYNECLQGCCSSRQEQQHIIEKHTTCARCTGRADKIRLFYVLYNDIFCEGGVY
jgi:hypothetical protein